MRTSTSSTQMAQLLGIRVLQGEEVLFAITMGMWVIGFSRAISIASGVEAELWALRDGLQTCINLNLAAVEVELDAKILLGWLSGQHNANKAHSLLITDCRNLLTRIPRVRMLHCYSEGNQCADKLARIGGAQQEVFKTFFSPPSDVGLLLYFYEIGAYHERLRSDFVSEFLLIHSVYQKKKKFTHTKHYFALCLWSVM